MKTTATVRPASRRPSRRGGGAGLLLAGLCLFPALTGADEPVWRLRGTIVAAAPEGYAIVENARTREQRWLRRGQALPAGDARIAAVYPDHALLVDDRGQRRLEFGARIARDAASDQDTYRLARDEIYQWIQEIDLVPHQREGVVVGYYANRIPERLRHRIGLQPGDVLKTVNGLALNNRTEPMRLYEQVRKPRVVLEVQRRGEPLQLFYRLE